MGSVGNPNPWAPPYRNYKDCSQGICSIYCPQFCYLIFPPPPSDDDSGTPFSPLIIAIIGVLASALLLVSYYTIVARYCRRRNDHNNTSLETDQIRDEMAHDQWQIASNGLDEALIKTIAVCKYQKSDGLIEGSECAVCLSEFQENESLRLLPKCSHAFHLPCIDTWLKSHSNCPLCRANVVVLTHPSIPLEPSSQIPTAFNTNPFEIHRPNNDLVLVVDHAQESCEQVVVSLGNDIGYAGDLETNGSDQESVEQFRRSISLGTFSCQRQLLVSDILKIEEIDDDLGVESVESWKNIGSSKGVNGEESKSSPVPVGVNRSISAGKFMFTVHDKVSTSTGKSEDVQNSGSLQYSNPSVQQPTNSRNTYTPNVIGIYMEPSVEYIVAVLSVLRCGEAFMPLDPTWPKARILSVISSSKANLIIGCKSLPEEHLCHRLDKLQCLIDDLSCPVLPISMVDAMTEQCYPSLLAWPCESECLRLFCYLMYTSGSSGLPKGVCGTEIGLLNRFLWMQDLYPLEEGDLVLFKTPISFIDHLQEFLGGILTTCTLVTPPFSQLKENMLYVIDFLQGYSINRLVAVPSLIRAMLPDLQSPRYSVVHDSLKLLVLSGEVLHVSLCEILLKSLPQTSILNLYGSTEVTGDCTYFDCKKLPLILKDQVPESVPIGLPVSNCDVMLVGEDAPNQGEIYVGGQCVAVGYLHYPHIMPLEHVEMPSLHDVECPSGGCKVPLYFKTGDFARKLPSGDLVFLGRKDRTIKVNGQRIALEEIESAFRDHPDVDAAAVICHEIEGEFLLLEAHLLLNKMIEGNELLKSSVRSWMLSKLPQMMIPSHIVFTRSLPLTSSGKVDYSSLAASTHFNLDFRSDVEEIPPDDLIQVILKVFSDALMVEKISVDDDFFEMGGDSMSAAYASFKLGIHMKSLYAFSTPLRLQMALLSSKCAVRTDAHSGMELTEPSGDMLLSSKFRITSYHGSKPRARSFVSDRDRDTYKPSKLLKAESNSKCLKELSSRDNDFWNLSPVHTACSFSRCNKGTHRGHCEGNFLYHTAWPNIIPKEGKGCIQELWKAGIDSCVDASPLVVFSGNDIRLLIGSHSHKFVCLDAKSGNVCWETKLQGRVECSAAILDDLSQVVVGCYEGKIYFLDFLNGSVCWNFQTSGEVWVL